MQRLRVGDAEIEYSDQGGGEPVVLVHAGFFSDWFIPLAARAELADVRVIRVRRAGYVTGLPPSGHVSNADHADHLAALLDTLHIERAHIVAHSSSANIGLQLAADRPERVGGLVLVEPARAGDSWPANDAIRQSMSQWFELAAHDLHAMFDQAMRVICAPDYAEVITAALGPGRWSERNARARFNSPTRCLRSWSGPSMPPPHPTSASPFSWCQCVASYEAIMADLAEWLPRATLTKLEGADHMLPLRDPATLAAMIAAFVRQHPTLTPGLPA